MAKAELNREPVKKTEVEDDRSSLRGTAVSVAILGAFLVITWVAAYFLYLNRF
ncbi:hypothetical protein J2Z40_001867 [Cytobacillus eiseniae]|uniref:Cytochrome c oxidase subunit 2A n=1 Tax=Cytobacillus eiseniae TaxID=762947 RepID=A0ABS4RG11_9BACI|nr:subunit I/II of b(o/a)3-type cytochrome C oxidase [Cytobacillus eiseniae]MBP2241305.1 hypothetical protein [Cytobacillus eiseniae]